ncbi:T-lymphocyte surface antigen Ly-9 isoform X1 [Xenopus laevis]|uniref:T-lymphocyte surface antigen Ly-9 isoform X1 n=2 Tax=Xenopus laevis TaxID=8355 RepID=A0A1L8FC52_XENLA|nr:T-lymphocyte surface antigen Ly-9 isoform X1 [Xenopus laevis]OCT69164.1 hypothetical protein XELAEV_18040473mg [Xenopus laevis]
MSQPWITLIALVLFSPLLLSSEVPDIQVHGLVNRTIRLMHHFGTNSETQCTVRWTKRGQTMEVAEYRSNRFTLSNQFFQNRINFSKSELRIYNLRTEDSGHYIISCRSSSKAPIKEKKYMLAIHEPLPTPTINKTPRECNATGCNITLQCLIPNTSPEVSCHWEILQEVSMNNRAFNECTIQVLLAFSSLDTEYVCFINNPADQKVVSVSAWQLCSVSGLIMIQCLNWRWWLLIVLGISLTVLFAVVLVKYKLYKRPCKEKKENREKSNIPLNDQNKNNKDGSKQDRQGGNISVEPKAGLIKRLKKRISSRRKKRQKKYADGPGTGQ